MSFKSEKISIDFKGTQKRLLEVYEGTVMAVDTKTSMKNVTHTTYTHVPGSFVPKVGHENNVYASQSTEVWLRDDQGNELLLEPAPTLKMRAGHRIRVVKAFPATSEGGWALQHNLTTGERIDRTASVYLTEKAEKQVSGSGPFIKAFLIAVFFALVALVPTYEALSRPLGLNWEERHPDPESTGHCKGFPKPSEVKPVKGKVMPAVCVVMVAKEAPVAVRLTAAAAIGLALFLVAFTPLFPWLRKRHALRVGIADHYKGILEQVNPKLRSAFQAM